MKMNDEIRRNNLLIAIERFGTADALAEAASCSSPYLSQVKNQTPESKTGEPKKMGDKVARRIEGALKEPPGWMDVDHKSVADASAAPDALSLVPGSAVIPIASPDIINELITGFFNATGPGRENILRSVRLAPKVVTGKATKSASDKS